MTIQEIMELDKPGLQQACRNQNLKFAVRWGKPKLQKTLIKAITEVTTETAQEDYTEFLNDAGSNDEVVEAVETEPEVEKPGPGGQRDGAGRPEGSTASHVRMKNANNVKVANPNLTGCVKDVMRIRKDKNVDEKVAEDAATSLTKVCVFLGIDERIRNTPYYMFTKAGIHVYRLARFMFGKKDDGTASNDNDDIRTPGDGENESSQEVNKAV